MSNAVMLRAVNRALGRVFAFGAGLSMLLVFAIVFANSLRRYLIGKSVEWGEELPVYLAVYGVMFGSALAYLQDRHIRFTIVTDFLPRRARTMLFAAIDILVAITGALLAWSGWLFTTRRGGIEASGIVGTAKDLAEATGLAWLGALGHMAVWQFSIVAGGAVLALAALAKFLARLAELRGPAA